MAVTNAFRLCIAILKQDNTAGTAYSKLVDPKYSALKWHLTSIIPKGYDFTSFQAGATQVEAVPKDTITSLSKATEFESGKLTPPVHTLGTMAPADTATLHATLDAITGVDDPFKVLFLAGAYNSATDGVRTYEVFHAGVGILTSDGARTGQAKQPFTGDLSLQMCHIPLIGVTACGATMTWTESTGVITTSFSGGGA